MAFQTLDKARWRSFFDGVSKELRGEQVEIEVASLDLGDQVEAEWLPLNGLTYDEHDDILYVYVEREEDLDHAITGPREIHVDIGDTGLSTVVVMDASGRKQLVRLRQPLRLPAEATPTTAAPPPPAR